MGCSLVEKGEGAGLECVRLESEVVDGEPNKSVKRTLAHLFG